MRVNLNLSPVNRNYNKVQKNPTFGNVNIQWAEKIILNPNSIENLFGEVLIAENYRNTLGKGKVLPNQVSAYDAYDTLAEVSGYMKNSEDYFNCINAMAALINTYGVDSFNQQRN